MHGRIFQITTKPSEKCETMTVGDVYDSCFVGTIADHVANVTDMESERFWLMQQIPKDFVTYNPYDYSFVLQTGFKKAYFNKDRFGHFIEAVAALAVIEYKDYVNGSVQIEDLLYRVNMSYSKTHYVYVYDGTTNRNGRYAELDKFIRYAKPKTKYYIGGILDYHA